MQLYEFGWIDTIQQDSGLVG